MALFSAVLKTGLLNDFKTAMVILRNLLAVDVILVYVLQKRISNLSLRHDLETDEMFFLLKKQT